MLNKFIPLLSMIGIFLVSCNYRSANSTPTATFSPPSPWLLKFIEQPTCQPPCWENIKPGETTISEVESILSEMPGIEITHMDREAIEWDFLPNRGVGKANSCCGGVKNYVVKYLYLRFSATALPLEDFVNAYGSPTFVFYSVGYRLDRCDLEVAYESLGMVLRSNLECSHAKNRDGTISVSLEIQANTPIDGISLKPINGDDYLLIQRQDESLDWKGYGEYMEVFHRE